MTRTPPRPTSIAPKKCLSISARTMSFTVTTAPDTASSRMTGRPTGRNKQSTAGRRSSPFSKNISRHHRLAPQQARRATMCSYIVQKASVVGSAKGPNGWMKIDTANVYFDHPYHAPLDHALGIDFVNERNGARERIAVELSADSARELVKKILAALESGESEHAAPAASVEYLT